MITSIVVLAVVAALGYVGYRIFFKKDTVEKVVDDVEAAADTAVTEAKDAAKKIADAVSSVTKG